MGFSFALSGFPIFVLIISIILGGGSLAGNGSAVAFNGQNPVNSIPTTDCSGFPHTPFAITESSCFPGGALPANGIITCQSPSTSSCNILQYCTGAHDPLYCTGPFATGFTVLAKGDTATLVNGKVSSSAASSIFPFGAVGIGGLIPWLGVAIAAAAIIGLQVLGSGEQSESIHILLMGGIFVGIWLFFSGLEGFLIGSAGSFFVQLNSAFGGLGSTLYVLLTFVYLMSFVKTVSRGGT